MHQFSLLILMETTLGEALTHQDMSMCVMGLCVCVWGGASARGGGKESRGISTSRLRENKIIGFSLVVVFPPLVLNFQFPLSLQFSG